MIESVIQVVNSKIGEMMVNIKAAIVTPILERLEALESEIEDLDRRTHSLIRLGKVEEIHSSGTLIRVRHGELITPFISWFAATAGDTSDYRCPSVGEQALLLNFAGGDNGAQVKALVGLPSALFPPPSGDPDEVLRVLPDGSSVSYHAKNHLLTVQINGDAKIDVTGDAAVTTVGKTSIDAQKIHLNNGQGCVTTAHICHWTGRPHGHGSSTVTAGY